MATLSSSNVCYSSNYGIPHEFICPLTLEIMNNPLMDRTGRSYERSAILEWITAKNSTCPITRQPLSAKDLLPNNKLRKEIMQWREEQGGDYCTIDVSLDEDAIQVEEITRAIRVWGENNFKCDDSTTYQRNRNRRRHHQHHSSNRSGGTTSFRFMRMFNREQ